MMFVSSTFKSRFQPVFSLQVLRYLISVIFGVLVALSSQAEVREISVGEGSELVFVDFEGKNGSMLPRFSIDGVVYHADHLPERYYAVSYATGKLAGYKGLRIYPVIPKDAGKQLSFLTSDEQGQTSTVNSEAHSALLSVSAKSPDNDEHTGFLDHMSQLLTFLRAQSNAVVGKTSLPEDLLHFDVDEVVYLNAHRPNIDGGICEGSRGSNVTLKRLVIVDDTYGSSVLNQPYKVAKGEEVIFIGLHDEKNTPVTLDLSENGTEAFPAVDCSEGQCHFYNIKFSLAGTDKASVARPVLKGVPGVDAHYDVWAGESDKVLSMEGHLATNILSMQSSLMVQPLTQAVEVLIAGSTETRVSVSPFWNVISTLSSVVSGLPLYGKVMALSSMLPVVGAGCNFTELIANLTRDATPAVSHVVLGSAYALGGVAVTSILFSVYMVVDFACYINGYQRFSLWRQVDRCLGCCCLRKKSRKTQGSVELGRASKCKKFVPQLTALEEDDDKEEEDDDKEEEGTSL